MIFVDWFFPGFKAGGPIQSCINLIEAFKSEWDIYVVTGDRDLQDKEPYPGIATNTWINFQEKARVYYAKDQKLGAGKIKQLVKEVQPDAIYLNGMFSWHFSVLPFIVMGRRIKTIIAPRGMLQKGALQFKKWKKTIFLAGLRGTGYYRNVFFHATDEQELKDIQQIIPVNAGISLAANFPRMQALNWTSTPKQEGVLRLVFLSRISPKKNLSFVLECLAKIPETNKISLTVAGEVDDEQYWISCKQLINKMPQHITVNYSGPVLNHLLGDFYKDFHVFILPTFGENYGHAIFEALLFGKPVIISNKTPWRHLTNKKIGYDLSLDDPGACITAIEHFSAMPQQLYDEWSKEAMKFASSIQMATDDLKEKYRLLFNKL